MSESTPLSHLSHEAHGPLPQSQEAAFLKTAHTHWKLLFGGGCQQLLCWTSHLFLSPLWYSRNHDTISPALKCQADHSEIQARLIQEGPNEKTFFEPSISSPAPSLSDQLGQAETETTKAVSWTKLSNMRLARISQIYIFIFYLTLSIKLILFSSA